VPHVNVGDLLYAEVAAKTPAGLEAQQLMDGGRTVPDRILLGLLLARLQQPDCVAQGWVLDGFPHTRTQVCVCVCVCVCLRVSLCSRCDTGAHARAEHDVLTHMSWARCAAG
jgi:hypothetical protein